MFVLIETTLDKVGEQSETQKFSLRNHKFH
jgi:hypothetical protein